MTRRLTADAQADRDDFNRMARNEGCTCFILSPCGYCTHPGNPVNLENDACYVPTTGSRNQREGRYYGRAWIDVPSTRMRGLLARKHRRSHVAYDQLSFPWWTQ